MNESDDLNAILNTCVANSCIFGTKMDDTQQSRSIDSNATRKRRSSILKSQRPPRTPFSELEFNVATPTDAGKSRRVSFSRRTGVAEFVTNEATTTWKNFYEEHNKSLESSGNESGANHPKQAIEHLGNRIFDQQFQEVEAIDFVGQFNPGIDSSMNNFTQQLASLECTADGKLTAPHNKFDLSALPDHSSKLFGNDINAVTITDMSGRINVNFSAIQQIGEDKDDLDEIQRDLQRVANNVVCQGPSRARQSLSEYIEVDLNMTHATIRNDESDMSITDTVHSPKVQDVSKSVSIDKKVNIDKDWVADKENIAINPYAAPKESANFALNEEPDKVLVFDGKRLTLQCEKPAKRPDDNYRQTLLPNLSHNVPQRKTIVLNTDDDLPNFVDNSHVSKIETSSITGIAEMNNYDDDDVLMPAPVNRVEISKRRTILDTANVSMTQAVPSNVILEGLNDKRKSVIYGDDGGNISMTRALPAQIFTNVNIVHNDELHTNKIEPKRRTFFDASANISMTQALPSNILSEMVPERRKSVVYDEDGNISITRALPAQILTNDMPNIDDAPLIVNKNPNRRTILDTSNNVSITQALPSNIISERLTHIRMSTKCDEEVDVSITKALPGHIFSNNLMNEIELSRSTQQGDLKRLTILDTSGNISMTQMLPSNILSNRFANNRKSVLYGDEPGDISITQAIPARILTAGNTILNPDTVGSTNARRKTILDDINVSITQALPSNIIALGANNKSRSVIYDDEIGNMSVTQALPVHILANTTDRRRRTINYDNDTGDISVTQAVPANIFLNNDKRRTLMSDNEVGNKSHNISYQNRTDNRRRTVVFEEDNISITQSVPASALLFDTKPQQKRQTIVYEDGNISVTQAVPNIILTEQYENLSQKNLPINENVDIPVNAEGLPPIVAADRISIDKGLGWNILPENIININKSALAQSRTVVYDDLEDRMDCTAPCTTETKVSPTHEINKLNNITIDFDNSVKRTLICENGNVSVIRTFATDKKLVENDLNKSSLNRTGFHDSKDVIPPINNNTDHNTNTVGHIIDSLKKYTFIATENSNVTVAQITPNENLTPINNTSSNDTIVTHNSNSDKKYLDDNIDMKRVVDGSLMYGRPNVPVVQAYLANVTLTDNIDRIKDSTVKNSVSPPKDIPDINEKTMINKSNVLNETNKNSSLPISNTINEHKSPIVPKTNSISVAYALLSNITSTEMIQDKMDMEYKNDDDANYEHGPLVSNNIIEEFADCIKDRFEVLSNKTINDAPSVMSTVEQAKISERNSAIVENTDSNINTTTSAVLSNDINPDVNADIDTAFDVIKENKDISMANALLADITSAENRDSMPELDYKPKERDNISQKEIISENASYTDKMNQKDVDPVIEPEVSVDEVLDKEIQHKPVSPKDSNILPKRDSFSSTESDKATQVQQEPDVTEPKAVEQLTNKEHSVTKNKSIISVPESVSRISNPNIDLNENKTTCDEGPSQGDENAATDINSTKSNIKQNLDSDMKILQERSSDSKSDTPIEELAVETRNEVVGNKSVTIEPRRLSFAPSRLSVAISREDLLNNISMAQAALQKSRIDFDDTDEEVKETQTDDSALKKSIRLSNEVVKTLHFEDESFSDYSMKSDTKSSPLKKTAFGETTYMKESKAKVIPTYLKDVSDGIKQLMSELVKPMTDVMPFEAAGLDRCLKTTSSVASNQVQANLAASSQIEMDCGLYSNPESCYNISTKSAGKTSDITNSSSRMGMDEDVLPHFPGGVEAARGRVLVFDHNNPLNNVFIGPMEYNAHRYNPETSKYNTTLCDSEYGSLKCGSADGKSVEIAIERVSVQYDVERRLSRAMGGDATSDKLDLTTITKPSTDQSVDVQVMEVKDTQMNTVIAMKDNRELLDANSSLTLVETSTSNLVSDVSATKITIDESKNTALVSPVRVIYLIEEKQDLEIEPDTTEATKPNKRNYSATKRDKCRHPTEDTTPKPINKMQKLSTSPNVFKTLLKQNVSPKKILEQLTAGHNISKMETDDDDLKEPNASVTIQQTLTEIKPFTSKEMDAVKFESVAPNTTDTDDSKSSELMSIANDNLKSVDSLSTNGSQCSALKDVSRVDWCPGLIQEPSSNNTLSECDSGANVVNRINALPFLGSQDCEWESSTADTWSFRLLYGRLRLVARLAHRVDNVTRCHVRADTPLHSVTVEHVVQDKNPVASLCVRFADEAMRYICSRLERGPAPCAKDVPTLLRRCSAAARVALRWGRAMQDARMQLAYGLTSDGLLTLKVANIPLRSVWEVTMRIELVVEDARETPWPRADHVCVVPIVSDAIVSDGEMKRVLGAVPRDWGHAPRAVWKIFRYLKHKRRDDSALLGM